LVREVHYTYVGVHAHRKKIEIFKFFFILEFLAAAFNCYFFILNLTSKVKEESIIIAIKELINCVEICEWTNLSLEKIFPIKYNPRQKRIPL
jgi:hypothetical protein